MKKKIIGILVCTLLITTVVSVTGTFENHRKSVIIQPSEEWSNTYGGPYYDYGNSVQQTKDGGFIVTGYTESYGAGQGDLFLIKTDSNGIEKWNKTYGGSDTDEGWYVIETSDGGYIITGYTESYGAGQKDLWIIKTDKKGDKEWDKTFGGVDDDWGWSVKQISDGGYIISGWTCSLGPPGENVYLIRTDSEGTSLWTNTFMGGSNEHGYFVEQTTDGGFIISGETFEYGAGNSDVWIIKTDSNGNEQWNKTYGGVGPDQSWSVQQTSDGGYFIAGTTKSFGAGNWDYYIIKTDGDGNELWSKTYGGGAGDAARFGQQTFDGGYIVTGWTCSYGAGSYDTWLIKTDSEGELIWDITFGGWYADSSMCVRQTNDGGYIISGGTESFGTNSYDVWLVKVKSEYQVIKRMFIIGRIDNLNDLGEIVTFEANNIRCIQLIPFSFIPYRSGEQILITKPYFGFITPKLICVRCMPDI